MIDAVNDHYPTKLWKMWSSFCLTGSSGLVLSLKTYPREAQLVSYSVSPILAKSADGRIHDYKHEHDEAIRFSYLLDLVSCTRIIGMSIAMECTHLRKYMLQYIWMTLSHVHSTITPWYPWGVKNKSLMWSVPDPSSLLWRGWHPHYQ